MGRIQRRDQAPQHGQDSPFVYLDRRVAEEREQVAETIYDAEGRRRASRLGWRTRTTYAPLPDLVQGPGLGAIIAGWFETLWTIVAAAIALGLLVCGAALAYTWSGDSWYGIIVYCVICAAIAIFPEQQKG